MADYSDRREYEHKQLDPETRKKIIDAARQGMSKAGIAGLARVHRNTLDNWLAAGAAEQPRPEHADLVELALDFHEARALWEQEQLAKVDEAGEAPPSKDSPRADFKPPTWRLEKALPKEYGNHQRHTVTGENGGPVALAMTDDDAVLARVQAAAARRRGGTESGGVPGASGA